MGVGIIGGIIGIGVAGFLILIPLKDRNFVNDLQSRFFATTDSAVNGETKKLFNSYVVDKVLPGYSKCGDTIDKHCYAAPSFGSDPVSGLYQAWRQNKLETKLAEKYGIEFKYQKASRTWHLIAPGLGADGADIGADGHGLEQIFNSRSGARAAISSMLDDALDKETKSLSMMERYKVGRLLEEKYGIRRCIIFCGIKDSLADKAADQKIAAKLFITQRVIMPRSKILGTALECFLTPSCDPTNNSFHGYGS